MSLISRNQFPSLKGFLPIMVEYVPAKQSTQTVAPAITMYLCSCLSEHSNDSLIADLDQASNECLSNRDKQISSVHQYYAFQHGNIMQNKIMYKFISPLPLK